ncbi:MAG TPA: helix-turn-helix domain-containing protein, partial [Nitrososphaeraceae archaeon]
GIFYLIVITAISFMIGFLISYLLKRPKTIVNNTVPVQRDNNIEIIEIIENKKQLQIDNIALKVNDLQIHLDLLESKLVQLENRSTYEKTSNIGENIITRSDNTSQDPAFNHITHDSISKILPTEKAKSKSSIFNEKHNATEHYILKLILKDSLTSNEIKQAIGRTREHTSRLMKKLYELKLVDRDITTKPFKYKLTEQGKKYIGEQVRNKEINRDIH